MRKKAFTLIEVLIATVIIVVSLLGALSLFNRETSLAASIKDESIALYALQEQIELIRGTSFTDIISAPAISSFTAAGFAFLSNPVGTVIRDYPFGTVSPNNSIVRVTVRLSWLSSNNRTKTKSIATFVALGGMGD